MSGQQGNGDFGLTQSNVIIVAEMYAEIML